MKKNITKCIKEFMGQFASNTGLDPISSHPKRYLWTDSFAVCNYLELHNRTQDKNYLLLATRLIDQVHEVLGKQHPKNPKTGWISGLNEKEGVKHPTIGGLRIGKEFNERLSNEPFNERLEWDRDGQYYHYLTKWMHALNNMFRVTGNVKYLQWALELAKTAHVSFTYTPYNDSRKRMYWKMSIDLSHPQIPSMGQHDPLDGFITYHEIQTSMKNFSKEKIPKNNLEHEINDIKGIYSAMTFTTDDPLGIGGLLSDATRISQLIIKGGLKDLNLLQTVLDSAIIGLKSYISKNEMKIPADYRLAFRELGLSIGIKSILMINDIIKIRPELFTNNLFNKHFNEIKEYTVLGKTIEEFWLKDKNRKTNNWKEHQDINTVMLATTLAPEAFLTI
jgi:hypothetical protein